MQDKKNDAILSIRGMSKSFGRNRVLDHINLDIKPGTVMGLMGENGAGKSTMMQLFTRNLISVLKEMLLIIFSLDDILPIQWVLLMKNV